MAKTNRIQFIDGHIAYNPTYSPQDVMADAPANAAPAKQVTTGQEQKNSVTAGPVGQAMASQALKNNLMGNFADKLAPANPVNPETYQYKGQYGNTWKPKVYNQDALNQYDKGLQAARDWDSKSSLSPGFKERVYKILNGERPQAQLEQYIPNAAMKYQTKDFNDGSQLQNQNTNPELALQWNVQKLKELHPDWDENTIQNYMNQNFNWQSAQALTNSGVWEPTQASKDWTNYLAWQAELQRQAEAEAAAAAAQAAQADYSGDDSGYYDEGSSYGGYGGSGYGGDDNGGGGDDSDAYNYTQSESDARANAATVGTPDNTEEPPDSALGRVGYNIRHIYDGSYANPWTASSFF